MFLKDLHFWAISLGFLVVLTNFVKSPSVSLARALKRC
jgi:cyclin-dependent kinase